MEQAIRTRTSARIKENVRIINMPSNYQAHERVKEKYNNKTQSENRI